MQSTFIAEVFNIQGRSEVQLTLGSSLFRGRRVQAGGGYIGMEYGLTDRLQAKFSVPFLGEYSTADGKQHIREINFGLSYAVRRQAKRFAIMPAGDAAHVAQLRAFSKDFALTRQSVAESARRLADEHAGHEVRRAGIEAGRRPWPRREILQRSASGEWNARRALCWWLSGRNNVQFFTEGINAEVMERMVLENSLLRALEKNEL